MRLIVSALGLSLALLSVAHKASADTILPASCATVPALCGYAPTTRLEVGIARFVDWYKDWREMRERG